MWPPPRMPVVNEGLVRDLLLKMVNNPGAHCYWEGATPRVSLLFENCCLQKKCNKNTNQQSTKESKLVEFGIAAIFCLSTLHRRKNRHLPHHRRQMPNVKHLGTPRGENGCCRFLGHGSSICYITIGFP